MRILLMTGPLVPMPGNNANLILKLVPYLLANQNEIHILASTCGLDVDMLPSTMSGCPIYWVQDNNKGIKRKYIYPTISKLIDRNGYSDAIQTMVLKDAVNALRIDYQYDAVVASTEPFPAADAASRINSVRKVLYIMDPPECTRGEESTRYRCRTFDRILAGFDAIISTPFTRDALVKNGYDEFVHKVTPMGFPMIETSSFSTNHMVHMDRKRINLLFCGWLCSDIRSPQYFLDIATRLDERFCIYFMGKECDKLRERFDFETKAEVVTLPQQPYQTAIDAMFDADILINIGNSVPVHMPSKTLEYINTGKPMVNFYKFEECPTRYYTDRYPLCLNLFEGDGDVDKAAEKFISFCLENKGKTVDREYIESEYSDCTPQYIAQQILDKLGEKHE